MFILFSEIEFSTIIFAQILVVIGAFPDWFLCSFDWLHFCKKKKKLALFKFLAKQNIHLIFSLLNPWTWPLLQGALFLFVRKWYLETKIWVLGVFIAIGLSLILGPVIQYNSVFNMSAFWCLQFESSHMGFFSDPSTVHSCIILHLTALCFNLLNKQFGPDDV